MKPRLIIAFKTPDDVAQLASESCTVVYAAPETLSTVQIIELAVAHQAEALLVTLGQAFGPQDIEQLPDSLKVIATYSVGYDHLNIRAFKARGIYVTNTPDVLTEATANLAMLLMLAIARRLPELNAITERGWGKVLNLDEVLGVDLNGKNLGILGMGRIGQAVAKRAKAFGMNILYCNRRPLSPELEQGAHFFKDFHEMLPHCQILSLHAPGTPQTAGIMNSAEFALLPKGALLINVARGSLVDEEALLAALDSGHLLAAGLDVCLNEPNPDPRLLSHFNILLTPHVGSATKETRLAMGQRALENIQTVFLGKTPKDNLL